MLYLIQQAISWYICKKYVENTSDTCPPQSSFFLLNTVVERHTSYLGTCVLCRRPCW